MLYNLTTIILLLNLSINATDLVDDGLVYIKYWNADYSNYHNCGYFIPKYHTQGIIHIYNNPKCYPEKTLIHELKHLYCWRKREYLPAHGGCFLNANISSVAGRATFVG